MNTYVVELNILMRTKQRVTRSTILAGTMSGGIKKETCKNSMVVHCTVTFDKLQFNGFIKSHKGVVPCLIEFVKYNYTE